MIIRRPMTDPWFPETTRGATISLISPIAVTWPAANVAVFVPAVFPASCTITALTVRASNANGNFDLGFYLDNLTLYQALGSTAMSNAEKTLTFTRPLRVSAGKRYWAAMVCSSTGTVVAGNPGVVIPQRIGMFQQSTALPLPSTAVPEADVQGIIPIFKLSVAGLPT